MFVEYIKKIVSISTQKYLFGAHVEESGQGLSIQIIQHKIGMTTKNVDDMMGYFNLRLFGHNCENIFFDKQLPTNEDTKFKNMFNNENFKINIKNQEVY